MPPGEQRFSRQRLSADRPEFSYRAAASGDGYLLSLGNSIDYLAAVIPQFADRDLGHSEQCITRDTPASGRLAVRGRRDVGDAGALLGSIMESGQYPRFRDALTSADRLDPKREMQVSVELILDGAAARIEAAS